MKHLNKNKAGFTLIELFIAISIFAVVAIALYSTFFAGISVWRRSGEGGNAYHNIRFMFDDMTKDLKNSIYMYSKKSKDKEESIYAFSGTNREIIFITLEDAATEDDIFRRELTRVAYRFDEGEGRLIRLRADKTSGFDIEKGKEEVLLKEVEDFKFEYCYETDSDIEPYEWKEEWEDDQMMIPRGVKATFLIKAEKIKEPLKITKIIFVPKGILGKEEIGL